VLSVPAPGPRPVVQSDLTLACAALTTQLHCILADTIRLSPLLSAQHCTALTVREILVATNQQHFAPGALHLAAVCQLHSRFSVCSVRVEALGRDHGARGKGCGTRSAQVDAVVPVEPTEREAGGSSVCQDGCYAAQWFVQAQRAGRGRCQCSCPWGVSHLLAS
jgi:hypothetical protein